MTQPPEFLKIRSIMGIDVALREIVEFLSVVLGVKPVWNSVYRKRGRLIATIETSIFYILIFLAAVLWIPGAYGFMLKNWFIPLVYAFATLSPVWRLHSSPTISGKSIKEIGKALAGGGKGEPFKIGWLYVNDIKFTVRRKEVNKLKELFKEHDAILLEGPSASGKTVIAKQFGLEMAKKGYFVYYANLTVRRGLNVKPEGLPEKLENELKGLDADIYLIIEDVHNYIDTYDRMNWVVNDDHIKLLLVSRPLKEFEFTKERTLAKKETEKLKWAYKFEIAPGDAIPQIIRHAVEHKGLKFEEGRLDHVKWFVRDNLYILVFAILAAKEKDKPLHEITDEDITKQVDDYIRGRRMPQFKSLHEKVAESFGKDELYPDEEIKLDSILKFIALTSRFELPVGEGLIAKLTGLTEREVRVFMRPLRKSGDVVELREGNRRSYIVPHARLAQLMADVLVESEAERLDFYLTYIKEGDYPGTLMERMGWNDREEFEKLLEKLRDNDFGDIPVEKMDFIETASAFSSLFSEDQRRFLEAHRDEILSKSLEDTSIRDIGKFLSRVAEFDIGLAKKIAQGNGDAISESLEGAYLLEIWLFLSSIALVNKEFAEELLNVHKKKILSKSFRGVSLMNIVSHLCDIKAVDKGLAKKLINMHKDDVLSKLSKSASLQEIERFLTCIVNVDRGIAKEVLKQISESLGGASVRDIGEFLSHIARVDRKLARKTAQMHGDKISKSLKNASVRDIEWLLFSVAKTDNGLAKDIAQMHGDYILSKFLEDASIVDIGWFLSYVVEVDKELARKIAKKHRDEILSKSIKYVSIVDIGWFLSGVTRVNSDLAKEIVQNPKDGISKALKNASVRDIREFLSNIAEANRELARVIAQMHGDYILSKFLEDASIVDIGWFLSYVVEVDKELARKIAKKHRDEILSKSLKYVSIVDIGWFLSDVAEADRELAKEIVQNPKDGISKALKNASVRDIREFLSNIAEANRELARVIAQRHGDYILSKFLEDASIVGIGWFLSYVAEVDRELAQEIVRRHRKEILSKSIKYASIRDIGKFLSYVAEADSELVKDIAQKHGKKIRLKSLKLKYASIQDIRKFLSGVAKANRELARVIARKHGGYISKALENKSMGAVRKFLLDIAEADRELAREIARNHGTEISKTLENASIGGIGWFLSDVAEADRELAKEIVQNPKDGISKALKNASVRDIRRFLSHVAEADSGLARVIVQNHRDEIEKKLKSSNWDDWLKFWLSVASRDENFAFEAATEIFSDATIQKLQNVSREDLLNLSRPVEFLKRNGWWLWDEAESPILSFTRRLICHYKGIIVEKFGSIEAMPKELAEIVKGCEPSTERNSPSA